MFVSVTALRCQTEQRRGGLGEVAFPILADPSHKIAGDYGVLVESQGVALRCEHAAVYLTTCFDES